ncbi:Rossmann-fold NAD(P)-binding domain-containing protein [Chryseobacterium salviniae]|uniref:Nucleoside-diphosphate-sugar epimerase n=1 Tax=Chryseobacterium salviniae TaxID=3101750 RepID=A0ABU6HRP3_9FLAO|nr:hypothetical protein [Chryseobacterium sp. T9W2-O]MEC3875127.1 hypothetical protein [Chryseobacterium sp. T9W2-O]
MKKIGIIGYGWLGSRIGERFSGNFEIFTTTTSPQKLQDIRSKGIHADLACFSEEKNEFPELWNNVPELDILIITVPFSERRSSKKILEKKLSDLFSFTGKFEKQVFFMSTTSVYPDEPGLFTEEMQPAENVFVENKVKEAFPQVNILRLGGLMGDSRLLKNFNISDLSGVVNHIHYKDIAEVILKMIEKNIKEELYNVVAPLHPSKQQVLAAQNNQEIEGIKQSDDKRIISSEKLISELEYTFIYPDPEHFHEDRNINLL